MAIVFGLAAAATVRPVSVEALGELFAFHNMIRSSGLQAGVSQ